MATQKDKARMCNALCQYMILISNWVSCETPITAVWHQAISHLDRYPHNEDKIWHMANAKIERVMPNKILKIKNSPPEPVDIIFIPNPEVFFNIETGPKEFHEHYQNLASIREEQEQHLEEINT
ncbi:hypothetical protein G9A89_005547 [Geosiphon pyriformis]|nr:hypothetical protein G9A89_005547 [Geosiphon pyriformis]